MTTSNGKSLTGQRLEVPRPTPPRSLPWQPFPVDALPEPSRQFVDAVSQGMGCDASYVALPLLTALTAAVGNTRDLRINDGWYEPCILWTACIGESATLKTPAFKRVLRFVRDAERQELRKHDGEMAEHDRRMLTYEKALAAWKHDKNSTDDPPEKPAAPICTRRLVGDVTTEAMACILADNPRGVLYARDELSALITSIDCYKGGKGADAQFWLSSHDAEGCPVDRKGGTKRTIFVDRPAVSICGGVQPGTLQRVMGQEHIENGMLQRFLVAHPLKRKPYYTEFAMPEAVERGVSDVFGELWALDFREKQDRDDPPRPVIVRLDATAKAEGIRFVNALADDLDDTAGALRAALSKIKGAAFRLALVVHLARCAAGDRMVADANTLDVASMRAGIQLALWFAHEARRLHGQWSEKPEDCDRRELAETIQAKGGTVTVRELTRSMQRFRNDADGARAALAELVKLGWGRWDSDGGSGPGRPSERFILNRDPPICDKTPVPDSATGGFVTNAPVDTGESAFDGEPPIDPERADALGAEVDARQEWGECEPGIPLT